MNGKSVGIDSGLDYTWNFSFNLTPFSPFFLLLGAAKWMTLPSSLNMFTSSTPGMGWTPNFCKAAWSFLSSPLEDLVTFLTLRRGVPNAHDETTFSFYVLRTFATNADLGLELCKFFGVHSGRCRIGQLSTSQGAQGLCISHPSPGSFFSLYFWQSKEVKARKTLRKEKEAGTPKEPKEFDFIWKKRNRHTPFRYVRERKEVFEEKQFRNKKIAYVKAPTARNDVLFILSDITPFCLLGNR